MVNFSPSILSDYDDYIEKQKQMNWASVSVCLLLVTPLRLYFTSLGHSTNLGSRNKNPTLLF